MSNRLIKHTGHLRLAEMRFGCDKAVAREMPSGHMGLRVGDTNQAFGTRHLNTTTKKRDASDWWVSLQLRQGKLDEIPEDQLLLILSLRF